ncbi:DUF1499 domain-containing protein [Brevundimonas sp.]|uniref:DUF1499 domain-containing protein n=1 Tax=Brevundimonas sp. TaxID=1871086 RepID=UPI00391954EF
MGGSRHGGVWLTAALLIALAAPVLGFAAAFGTRVGLIDWRLGYEQLTLVWGWRLAWVSAGAALATVLLSIGDVKRRGLYALVAVLAAGVTLYLHMTHRQALAAHPPVHEAASDWDEPLSFSGVIRGQRDRSGAAPLAASHADTCDQAVFAPTQVAPQAGAAALEATGFTVVGTSPFRIEGRRESFWFGFTHDAVLRIRPGRTDLRVSGREARPDGGEACRLAGEISARLRAPD